MKPVLAIDPGTTESQWVMLDGEKVAGHGFRPNVEFKSELAKLLMIGGETDVCIEGIASYGMAVGREVFETCIWIGRFYEVCESRLHVPTIMYRKDVKLHLCGTPRAKDPNVRQAIIDRYGGKDTAIGKKKTPGPLYGISSHAWAALALGITFTDRRNSSLF